ncbi:hypothetical protein ABE29_02020 [Cytobacillus firmus]|uniref:hypothetical protein n=1 Tax=Cytobacillus firmus TaxID=1399 RepID=UPI00077C6F04|nr:hypothetical protein [Cytobacillus firmus]MBG9541623.1 hypothetical protein [Cytobacillus firmus]MBG9553526.1 hypothetical protein [Cytobacillus firmus]MBG9556700.1 hypothetical protein [Cytobacillus firmus]MBG9574307.1 hypothetical protein [Cytobacillus firmus]MEC1895596.1 hypothetical protein [Cytobacillus firmus]
MFSPTQSNAEELTDSNSSGVIDLNNLEKLEESGDVKVTINKLTYDEFIENRAKAKGITIEQAKEIYKNPNNTLNTQSGKRTLSTMSSASDFSMHEINIEQDVSLTYKPTVQIFVYTYNSGSFSQFDFIEEVDLDRDGFSNLFSKQFAGKVNAKITTPTKIWWNVNGDFFDNGTTSVTMGFGGGLGQKVTASFEVSHESNHFDYYENTGVYSIFD